MIIAMIANSYILAIIEQRRNKVVISYLGNRSPGNVDTDNRKVNTVFKYVPLNLLLFKNFHPADCTNKITQ